jgi:lysophospholipid hydrolase
LTGQFIIRIVNFVKNGTILRGSRFFEGIPAETRDRLIAVGEERSVAAGEELFAEGDPADSLWIVLEGSLEALTAARDAATPREAAATRDAAKPREATATSDTTATRGATATRTVAVTSGREQRLGLLGPGDPIGEIAVLLGGRRTATVRAFEYSRLAHFARRDVLDAATESPALQAALEAVMTQRLEANRVLAAVYRFFGDIDPEQAAFISQQLERRVVNRGEYLFRFGDPGDALFIVVSGSFEVLVPDADGKESPVALVRRGEPIGEMALLADDARGASIRAARASEVVVLSRDAFERVSLRYPKIVLGITRVLVKRFRSLSGTQVSDGSMGRSIVLLPGGTEPLALESFAHTLANAMPEGLSATVVSSTTVATELGNRTIAFAGPGDPRASALEGWLEENEARFDLVFYVPDPDPNNRPDAWIRRCITRADEVMICAGIDSDPALGPAENVVYEDGHADAPMHRRLVLLHEERSAVSHRSILWLALRPDTTHLHLRREDSSDMRRLARVISGRSVGLALGGGGARGIAHVGVLRALHESGVPVDKLAGTSMGAVVGALYGAGFDTRQMLEQIEAMFVKLNPFNEYTLPVYSLLRGRKPALASLRTYGDLRIEDLWLPFVCTSTNVSRQQLAVHRNGELARAILASTALPGVTVPIVYEGQIHVDGGVINNLPGDLLRGECLRLITSDVNPVHHFGPAPETFPSPWKSLIPGWMPDRANQRDPANRPGPRAPRIGALLFASMNAGSQRAAAEVRRSADLSLTPPTEDIGLLDFKRLQEIARRGYDHTMRRLETAAVHGWETGSVL